MQSNHPLRIQRDLMEMPLFIISLMLSAPIFFVLVVSIFGLIYGLFFALLIFMAHTIIVSHIRGNGIRITSEQLPEIYQEVTAIAQRIGLKKLPEIYIINGNGVLNAFVTKFLFSRLLVIHSNLLDACEGNAGARAMIIGHELGHIQAGHLRWSWLTWTSHLVPFFSGALSRAREYTADKYGYACADNKEDALLGLLILAGGKRMASNISVDLFVSQIESLNTGFMRIGEWMQTHPVLAKRVYAITRNTSDQQREFTSTAGTIKGLLIVSPLYVGFLALMITLGVGFYEGMQQGLAKSIIGQERQNDANKSPNDSQE